eukprot:SAG31_NODE_1432_length_8373_cov_8.838289_5_plen_69_part_00
MIFAIAIVLLWHLEGVQVAILQFEGADDSAFAARQSRAIKLQHLMMKRDNLKRYVPGQSMAAASTRRL